MDDILQSLNDICKRQAARSRMDRSCRFCTFSFFRLSSAFSLLNSYKRVWLVSLWYPKIMQNLRVNHAALSLHQIIEAFSVEVLPVAVHRRIVGA